MNPTPGVVRIDGNCWEANLRVMTMYLKDLPNGLRNLNYDISLDRMDTSARVLDAILQVSQKTWATDKVVSDMVRMLDRIFRPQSFLCSSGMEQGPINPKSVACHNCEAWSILDGLFKR